MDESLARARFEDAITNYSQEFGTFFLLRFLGLSISYLADTCVVSFSGDDFLYNPQGSVHGGIIATIMDVSMGHLINHLRGPAVTLEMKNQFIRPISNSHYQAVGEVVNIGREICFLKSRVEDSDGKIMATASSTWKLMK